MIPNTYTYGPGQLRNRHAYANPGNPGPWNSRAFFNLARNTAEGAGAYLAHASHIATEYLPRLSKHAGAVGLVGSYLQTHFGNSQTPPSSGEIVWDYAAEQAADNRRFNSALVQPQSLNPGRSSNLSGLARKPQPKVGPGPSVRKLGKRKRFLSSTPPAPAKKWWRLASSSTPITPTQSFSAVSQLLRKRNVADYQYWRGKLRSRRNYTRAKLLFARTRLQRLALRKSAQHSSRRYRRWIRKWSQQHHYNP